MKTGKGILLVLTVAVVALVGCTLQGERRALDRAVAGYNVLSQVYLEAIRLDKKDGSLADDQMLSAEDVREIERVRLAVSDALDVWRVSAEAGIDEAGPEARFNAAWAEFSRIINDRLQAVGDRL